MLTVALIWSWWTERNKENHNETRLSAEEMQYSIKHHANEWIQFFKPKPTAKTNLKTTWQPPSNEFIKINTDGAFLESERTGGWG